MRPALKHVTLSAKSNFYERTCHMFPISKCRGDWDLSLCTFWVPVHFLSICIKRTTTQCQTSIISAGETRFFFRKSPLRSGSPYASTKKWWDLNLSLLYLLILGTYGKFARRNNFLALGVCFPQPWLLECWPQVCRVKITFILLPTNRFVSTTTNLMKCLANWIPLRIRVCSRNTQTHLKVLMSVDICSNRCAMNC
jgi:hypothetical protein